MHQGSAVRSDFHFEGAHIGIFDREMVAGLGGDLDFLSCLGQQGNAGKKNRER